MALMMSPLTALEISSLDARVTEALATGHDSELTILGYGEISLVIQLEKQGQPFACKRLPIFPTPMRADRYRDVLDEYLERLRRANIHVAPTSFETLERGAGRVGYCVQPALRRETIGTEFLRRCSTSEAEGFWDEVLERVASCVGPTLGLDAQLSNWAVQGDSLTYLDVTTPFMRDAFGRELLDTELFMSSVPALMRLPVRWVYFKSIFDKYYHLRGVALDFLGNLFKERLEAHIDPFLDRVNRRLDVSIQRSEVEAYYREDAQMWAIIQKLRRFDRFCYRHILRRPYPILLPPAVERSAPPRAVTLVG
jgi:Family of unknown function (DUF6206)